MRKRTQAVALNVGKTIQEPTSLASPGSHRRSAYLLSAAVTIALLMAKTEIAQALQSTPGSEKQAQPTSSEATSAYQTQKIAFSIKAQPLEDALNEFARQTRYQVLSQSGMLDNRTAPPVNGTLTPEAALQALLSNSTLRYKFVNPRTVTISAPDRENLTKLISSSSIRLAQNSEMQSNSSQAAQQPQGAEGTTEGPTNPSSTAGEESKGSLEEITITGSRLSASYSGGPAPVVSFDRARIEELGSSTVGDVLRFLPEQSFSFQDAQLGQTRSAQLRGLSVGTTLVLINGRRTVTSGLLATAGGAFDLNTIPLAAVERIEVLPGGASAVYGADAVGGVVNVILKTQVNQPTLDLRYGLADGGAEETRVSFTTGYSNDRFRGSLILDYFDQNVLLGAERDPWRDRDFRRFGGPDSRVTFSNPGNICRAGGGNLPGLSTPCAAVPVGSTGVGLTPASFLETAGQQNKTSSNTRELSIIPGSERYSAVGLGAFDLTSTATLFGEVMYSHHQGTSTRAAPVLQRAAVPASNAFNPFGVAVQADYQIVGLDDSESLFDVESARGVIGLKGDIDRWRYEFSALAIRDWSDNRIINGALNSAAVRAALASSDPATALNVFKDGPGASPEILAGLLAPAVTDEYSSRGLQFGGFLTGELFALPGGPLEVVIGGEWRTEKLDLSAPSAAVSLSASDANRDSTSLFSELRVPIVGRDMAVAAVESLTFTAAARHDDYSDFGSTFNPQYGLEWRLVADFMVRASYGTSFRAPALFATYQPSVIQLSPLFPDPARNNALTIFEIVLGGNPDLRPETSEYSNIGFVWDTRRFGNLRLEADYWRISQEDRLQTVSGPVILANEALFPGRVIREAPSASDIAAGIPGVLTRLESTWLNFGTLETSGVDVRTMASIQTAVGRFSPSLAVTWIEKYDDALLPGAPVVQRAGFGNVAGTIPRWKGTATLAWSRAGLGAAITGRYNSSWKDVTTTNVATGRTIPARVLIDAQVSIVPEQFRRNGPGWMQPYRLRAGVSNLFDQGPDYTTMSSFGVDNSQGDPRQRFFYVNLSRTF